MQSALDSAIGLPNSSTSAAWMLGLVMPFEVRRIFMVAIERSRGRPRRSSNGWPRRARRSCSGPALRVTFAPRDGLTDPAVPPTIAPPPHAEERHRGRDEDRTDLPPIDVHTGERGPGDASAHPLNGGARPRTTPTCDRLGAGLRLLRFNPVRVVGLRLPAAVRQRLDHPTVIPLATALFATLIHERLTRIKLIGFAVATVGAALVIAGGQQGGEATSSRLRGDLMELGAAAGWAASLTIGAVVLRKESVLGYVTLMVLIGTLLIAPLGWLAQGYRDVPSWAAETWIAAGFLGVFSTALALVLVFLAVHRFGAGLAGMGGHPT